MRESQVEKHLAKRVAALGGLCWKFVSPNLRGVPDRVVVMPEGRVFFVELKAPGEMPEPHQLRRHKELRMCGCLVLVLDSTTAIDYWLEQFE